MRFFFEQTGISPNIPIKIVIFKSFFLEFFYFFAACHADDALLGIGEFFLRSMICIKKDAQCCDFGVWLVANADVVICKLVNMGWYFFSADDEEDMFVRMFCCEFSKRCAVHGQMDDRKVFFFLGLKEYFVIRNMLDGEGSAEMGGDGLDAFLHCLVAHARVVHGGCAESACGECDVCGGSAVAREPMVESENFDHASFFKMVSKTVFLVVLPFTRMRFFW